MASPARSAPDTSRWPTTAEAATILATGERTIRRWIESGRLHSAIRPAEGRKPLVIVDPADVERLRVERLPPVLIQSQTREIVRQPVDIQPRDPGAPPDRPDAFAGLAAHLARLAAAFPSAPPKPWLTLDEAAAWSGHTRAWLLSEARSGNPFARDESCGGTNSIWRFSREALAK